MKSMWTFARLNHTYLITKSHDVFARKVKRATACWEISTSIIHLQIMMLLYVPPTQISNASHSSIDHAMQPFLQFILLVIVALLQHFPILFLATKYVIMLHGQQAKYLQEVKERSALCVSHKSLLLHKTSHANYCDHLILPHVVQLSTFAALITYPNMSNTKQNVASKP